MRREVGRHAKNLNKIIRQDQEKLTLLEEKQTPVNAGSYNSLSSLDRAGDYEALLNKQRPANYLDGFSGRSEIGGGPLEESVGHDELQVVAGALLGFLVSLAVETLIG